MPASAANTTSKKPSPPPAPSAVAFLDLRTWAAFILRWRWLVVAIWGIALLASIPFSLQVTTYLNTGGYTVPNSEAQAAQTVITQNFGAPQQVAIVVFQSSATPTSDSAYAREIAQFTQTARAFPHVTAVIPGGVSADGRATYFTITFSGTALQVQNQMSAFQRALPQSPARAYLTGDPAAQAQIADITKSDLAHAESFAVPIAALVLFLVFGTLIAAAIPLALGLIALALTFAAIFFISQHVEMSIYVVNIMSAVGMGICIDYTLFLTRRYRDELRAGRAVADAVSAAVATAGEAILFSGLTVLIGFAALALLGLPFMTSIAIGGALVVTFAVLGALTLAPALLGILGPRVFATRWARPWQGSALLRSRDDLWRRFALGVMRRPWQTVALVVVVMGTLALPLFSMRLGLPGVSVLPAHNGARVGLAIFEREFPKAQAEPVVIVLRTTDGSPMLTAPHVQQLCDFTRRIQALPGAASVSGLTTVTNLPCDQVAQLFDVLVIAQNPQLATIAQATTRGDTTIVQVQPSATLDSPASQALVTRLRALRSQAPFRMAVGGQQAASMDLAAFLYRNIPLTVFFVLLATYLVLFLMFGSVLLPLKAILMNLLSVGAAYGIVIWIFQQGNLHELLGFTPEGYIEIITPILMFCILFGLSMDYEVFLLSRIREEWRATGDNTQAVARGLATTAGTITSAAALIVITSGAFIFTQLIPVKEQGLGITVAIILDATIIRIMLVPAVMRLMGRWNWFAPDLTRLFATPTPKRSQAHATSRARPSQSARRRH